MLAIHFSKIASTGDGGFFKVLPTGSFSRNRPLVYQDTMLTSSDSTTTSHRSPSRVLLPAITDFAEEVPFYEHVV